MSEQATESAEALHPDVCPTCLQYKDSQKRLFDLIGTMEVALHKAEESGLQK